VKRESKELQQIIMRKIRVVGFIEVKILSISNSNTFMGEGGSR
jgi:hypothetical protein